MGAAFDVGLGLERRALDRFLASGELDRFLSTALDDPSVRAALQRALESEGAVWLVESFVDSGLFERILDRLMNTDAMWRVVDEIARSPAVAAAISQQGLGFADQVSGEARARARNADDWLERAAHRMVGRGAKAPPEAIDATTS